MPAKEVNSVFDAKAFLKHLTTQPGIYQMLNKKGKVLYIGKARNIKKRLSSYFQNKSTISKTYVLMKQVANIEVTVTRNENEALLLESNLIKQLKPRYNVLLRDDKSYPYIYLSQHQDFPRLDFYRGKKIGKGRYFGPYPNANAVRETLRLLQKIFRIRSCKDVFFHNRTRPCLQYQIKRCSAPCVGLVEKKQYQQAIHHTTLFLEGKNQEVIDELAEKMQCASRNLAFERAAKYRDQMLSLRRVQEKQFVTKEIGNIDVMALTLAQGYSCVQVLYIRGGRVIGSHSHFPQVPEQTNPDEIMSAFIAQYYLNAHHAQQIPRVVIINVELTDKPWLEAFLSEQKGKKVEVASNVRGARFQWLSMAIHNAKVALQTYLATRQDHYQRFALLGTTFNLNTMPQRLECFDVSHTSGEATVAACVVFGITGAIKKDYRRFNIKDITQGDDYAAMKQALIRHYTKLKAHEADLPDILFIDGGKGQVAIALHVLEELQISGVSIIGIAKGVSRKPGLETLVLADPSKSIHLPPDSPVLHLIQQIRDEAHRFAITGHRRKRDKRRRVSLLESIEGIGQVRRQALLSKLGGLQELKRASVDDLAQTKGISYMLAQKIFDQLHRAP